MRLRDINSFTDAGAGRLVPLSADLWAHAALLGAARQREGGGRADRGRHNTHVDHMGAFGELLLLDLTRSHDIDGTVLAHFQTHLYIAGSAAPDSTPDLKFADPDKNRLFGIDAKTFDCDKVKRYFAINDSKHRGLAAKCDFYFCALARPLGRRAAVAKLVPYEHVQTAQGTFPDDRWFVGNLLSRGSPSRNLLLNKFLREYFTNPPDLNDLRKHPYSRREILERVGEQDCRDALQRIIPSLNVIEAWDRVRAWNSEQDQRDDEKRAKAREGRARRRDAG